MKVFDLNGVAVEELPLPPIFSTPYRPDVIQRAVLAAESQRRQPYGTDVLAGKRTSAHYHGRRRVDIRIQMMNREMARLPRIHGKSAGFQAWRARFVPQARGGREAHPPVATKSWAQKINRKEYGLAMRSAIAATTSLELSHARGHSRAGPIVLVDAFEQIKKTRDVQTVLERLGLDGELERCKKRKVRAGRGKMRGRRYRTKSGLLLLVSRSCPLLTAARGLAGVDVVTVEDLDICKLAPGAQAGRLLVRSKAAVGKLQEVWG